MERKTLAKWLVVAALACLGLGTTASAVLAETAVQGSQTSDGADATTGTASGSNTSSFAGGPSSSGASDANTSQNGSNRVTVDQGGSAKTGDPVAGSQVTGAVADDVTVQNQNNATNATALSGEASLFNSTLSDESSGSLFVGPFAVSTGGPANASQIGDNILELTQTAQVSTGDAVAGSQVTGIVGDGEHTVQNQNTATCEEGPCAESGAIGADALTFNAGDAVVGPTAVSDTDAVQASQIGDNDAVIGQSLDAHTGDALNASQVTGVVGGSATVQNQNDSSPSGTAGGGGALTGDASFFNVFATVGTPGLAGPQGVGPTGAQATQNGDNSIDLSQLLDGSTGDALSGSQVTGAVGDEGGYFTVQNQQASENDEAESGIILDSLNSTDPALLLVPSGNGGVHQFLNAGPAVETDGPAAASQIGDNDLTVAQSAALNTGDALAGSQVTGDVGHNDVTVQEQNNAVNAVALVGEIDGEVVNDAANLSAGPSAVSTLDTANASQIGDNAVAVAQAADLSTGDAVAGSQVTGVVTGGASPSVTIQNTNTSEGAQANDGDSGNINFTGLSEINHAIVENVGPDAESTTTAQATQNGDNAAAISQAANLATGDAVAGSQVNGVVADGNGADVTVQTQNSDIGSNAEIPGIFVDFVNDIEGAELGAEASSGDDQIPALTAQASQLGDNAAVFEQLASISTGDGLAGATVTGLVTGDNATIDVQEQGSCDTCSAEGGNIAIEIVNTALAPVYVGAGAAADDAQASQVGDNSLAWTQGAVATTGDAVAGAQVTGVVSGDNADIDIQNQQTSDTATALAGSYGAETTPEGINTIPVVVVGAEALGGFDGTASATQNGDNAAALDQAFVITTGDAVAGSQVSGVVAGDNSVVELQTTNDSVDALANDGDTAYIEFEVGNSVGDFGIDTIAHVGVIAEADTASASQLGDNSLDISQDGIAVTGDAVAGGQIAGLVTGDNSASTVQALNSSNGDVASTGGILDPGLLSYIGAVSGVTAIDGEAGTANASQIGDNAVTAAQSAAAQTGDAVAGGQVTGAVTGDGSEVTVQNSNSALDNVSTSGDIGAASELGANLSSTRTGVYASGDTAQATQNGDNTYSGAQDVSLVTGDAVGGAQVSGVVGGDGLDLTVQNANSSTDPQVDSGDVGFEFANSAEVDVSAIASGLATANASQIGDNAVISDQNVDVSTGDAVGGSQITGAVAGDGADITAQHTNSASGAILTSGDIDVDGPNGSAVNQLFPADSPTWGPSADADTAQASQNGDNAVDASQSGSLATGDAVGGSQIVGLVAGARSASTVQNSNACTVDPCADAESGTVTVTDDGNVVGLDGTGVGPSAVSGDGAASAEQLGDNGVVIDQSLSAASGDAVAGSQVTGGVFGDGSDSTVQNTNSSAGALATSGDVTGLRSAIDLGSIAPSADALGGPASAQQVGDNGLDFSQAVSAASGDAVAGSQVTGLVGGDATVQVSNNSADPDASSGLTDAANSAVAALAPTATSDDTASANMLGDTGFDAFQGLEQSSGDAVAGGQIGGHVAA